MTGVNYHSTCDISTIERSKWHDYVMHHPHGNVFQTPEMYQVLLLSDRIKPFAIFCLSGSDMCGVAVLAVHSQYGGPPGRLTARAIMTGGPLVNNDDPDIVMCLLDQADKILRGTSIYLEIRNVFDTATYKGTFSQSGFESEPHLNILIDLRQGEDQLWKNLHPTRRKQISRSRRRSVTVRSEKSIDEKTVIECYSLLKGVYAKAHLPLDSQEFFISSVATLSGFGLLRIFLAEADSKIIGFRFILCYRDTLYDWYAASDESYLDRYPNDLLPWEVMAKGVEEGYSIFDFGGAGRPGAKYGVRDFKLKFGGALVNFGRYRKVYDPILFFIISRIFRFYRKIFRSE